MRLLVTASILAMGLFSLPALADERTQICLNSISEAGVPEGMTLSDFEPACTCMSGEIAADASIGENLDAVKDMS